MKNNSSGHNVRANDTPPEGQQRDGLKSYIDGLKKVTNQKTKQRNPNKQKQNSQQVIPVQLSKNQPRQMFLGDSEVNIENLAHLISPANFVRSQSRQGRQSNVISPQQILLSPQNNKQINTQFSAYQQNQLLKSSNTNLGNKAMQYLQKKGNINLISPSNQQQNDQVQFQRHDSTKDHAQNQENNQKQVTLYKKFRRASTRGGQRNASQGQVGQFSSTGSTNFAMMSSSQNFNKKQLSGLFSANVTNGFPQTTKNNNSDSKDRNQKEIIVRKNSSKTLLNPANNQQQQRNKSQQPRSNLIGAIKTDSTAADENKRLIGLTHSIGNQGSINNSSGPPGIFYRDTHTLKDTLGNNKANLSNMLRNHNLLDEDGIEDLHFYFVQFNQHKSKILSCQCVKGAKRVLESTSPTVQNRTIESCDGDLF